MTRTAALAIGAILAGCASSPPPAQAPTTHTDPRVALLQQGLDEAIGAERSLRRRFSAEVLGAETRGADVLFSVALTGAPSWGREARHFDLLVGCGADQTDDCIRKAMAAVRGAAAAQ